MIEVISDLRAGAIGFSAKGKLTAADYENVIMPDVAAVVEVEGDVRLLWHMGPEFEGFENAAIWDDAVMGFRHALDWDRIAVVSDIDWVRYAVKAMHWVLPGGVRLYPNARFEEARAWINEPDDE